MTRSYPARDAYRTTQPMMAPKLRSSKEPSITSLGIMCFRLVRKRKAGAPMFVAVEHFDRGQLIAVIALR